MLFGPNKKLEDALRRFNAFLKTDDGESFEEFRKQHYDLTKAISLVIAVGEKWAVLAESREYDEEEEMEKALIRCIKNQNNEEDLIAFTSKGAVAKAGGWADGGTEMVPAETILELMLRNEQITALVLNPREGNDCYVLNRRGAEIVYEWAKEFKYSGPLTQMEYRMEPIAVIDTDGVFEELWGNEAKNEDLKWRLDSYPIMPDGSVMLNYTAKKDDGSEICRSVHLKQVDNGFAVGTFEVDLHGASLGTTAVFDGELWGVITGREDSGYVAQKLKPWDENTRCELYSNINTVVWKPDGALVVGYRRNMRDPQKLPLGIFDREGHVDWHKFELALECRDVNLDRENNVWAYIFPSNCLMEIDEKGGIETVPVYMHGFNAFAISSDRRKLVTFFSHRGDECRIFVQHLTEDGYGDPIVFNFEPLDGEGNLIDINDCKEYGRFSIMKDRFMLLVDGSLYYYSADLLAA